MTFRDLELLVGCTKCGAVAGEMCRTRSGRRATLVHASRAEPIYAAWREGFTEGQSDAVAAMDDHSEWSVRYLNDIRSRRAS